MKALLVGVALSVFTFGAHAETTYKDYDDFYRAQPGVTFRKPVRSEVGIAYSVPDERGVSTKLHATLNGKAVQITLRVNRITVNGHTYRFANAVTFSGERPSDIYPPSTNVFVASRTNIRPDMLCVQGASNGSGEADRHTQIYLLINPLSGDKAEFLHLPSLLSSCWAVRELADGRLIFPSNSYRFDDAQSTRVGLRLSYFTFGNRRFTRTSTELQATFASPDNPFEFSIQDVQK